LQNPRLRRHRSTTVQSQIEESEDYMKLPLTLLAAHDYSVFCVAVLPFI